MGVPIGEALEITCKSFGTVAWLFKPSPFYPDVTRVSDASVFGTVKASHKNSGTYFCYGQSRYGVPFLDQIRILVYGKWKHR